ncbi:hypothetical protein HNP47_001154 [Brevundimonas vesicularis]|uniref:Uncharacterized protein n=1 Tax=Brevundimonas vesicularis TaxID=41276 RepID=A0A7W9FTB4_BREVE|nr:hypothetical protein [Brevundimonas vesicularis]MBB5771185.1 hypothetical protein [Brevundimonas vesicularis]
MIVMTTGLSALMALMQCETRPVEPPQRLDTDRADPRPGRPRP